MVSLAMSSVGAERFVASADVSESAGEGLRSNSGASAGVLVSMASAAGASSSDRSPNQSDALWSLDEEVGLGFFSGKLMSGSSEENLRQNYI